MFVDRLFEIMFLLFQPAAKDDVPKLYPGKVSLQNCTVAVGVVR